MDRNLLRPVLVIEDDHKQSSPDDDACSSRGAIIGIALLAVCFLDDGGSLAPNSSERHCFVLQHEHYLYLLVGQGFGHPVALFSILKKLFFVA